MTIASFTQGGIYADLNSGAQQGRAEVFRPKSKAKYLKIGYFSRNDEHPTNLTKILF